MTSPMSFLHHVRVCNAHQIEHFRPFLVGREQVGWVRAANLSRLGAYGQVFVVRDDRVELHPGLTTPEARTRAVEEVLRHLVEAGAIEKLRGERYPVATRWGAEPLFEMDRAAVSLFGIRAYGIHLNGFVRRPDGLHLWVGKRAADKPVAPGKLDNLVAGGQPAGLSLHENLLKECAEEADMAPGLASRAVPVGALSYCMENDKGLKPDVLFVYDLELPGDFVPRNTDGEIESFALMPAREVLERVRSTQDFKFNVNLVLIDFGIRHGLITPENEPDYLELVRGLRAL